MQVSIIIVNYQSLLYLKKCLESIDKIDNFVKEIIVINNDKNPLKLKKSLKIKVIENGKNLGFGKASNIGAEKATGKYLFFLNPDTKIFNLKIDILLEEFENNSSLEIIGPQIINAENCLPQKWSCGKKANLWQILFKKFGKKYWKNKKPTLVDWVSGGALFIKKQTFEKIGGFDENFFMYFEDQDLCFKIKTLNKKCLFYPYFKILHYDGKSWKGDFKRKKAIYYKSQEYFFKKHLTRLEFKIYKLLKKLLKK